MRRIGRSGLDVIPPEFILLASGLLALARGYAYCLPQKPCWGHSLTCWRLCLIMPNTSVIGAESSKEFLWLS